MATMMVKVCEECGRQSVSADGWLVVRSIDITSANTSESVMRSESDTDLCSPGCVLRYVSKRLEPAMNCHSVMHRRIERPAGAGQPARIVA